VTEDEGQPAAVLIRALAPLEGIELMQQRRSARRKGSAAPVAETALCRGPGNLTVAMAIDRGLNGADLVRGPMTIEDRGIAAPRLVYSGRIGIRHAVDRPWRCHWEGHAAVSGR
jgi:DNA-3-methyladenine glycosylase